MNRFLVESATHEEQIATLNAELGSDWDIHWNAVAGVGLAHRNAGRMRLLQVDEPFGEDLFPDSDEKVRTRLGAEGIRLTLPTPMPGPFGENISALTLPAHWSIGLDPTGTVVAERTDEGLHVSIDGRGFIYNRWGTAQELRASL
jgi:CRISPR-associated endonuclease/helicase Cas3